MPAGYQVRSVIICDDVRREANGKEILIGVYNDNIVLRETPMTLMKFVFRCALLMDDASQQNDRFHIRVLSPSGKQVVDFTRPVGQSNLADRHRIFGITVINIEFPELGTYDVEIAFDEATLEKVWDFEVRLARQEEMSKFT